MSETADWQKGIALDRLKAFAEPFKLAHKPFVFGAFGLTKERDIADALDRNRCTWTGEPPQAVALFSFAKKPSEQSDFAQRQFTIPAGSVFIKAFAARDKASGVKVLESLKSKAEGRAIVAELFEEDRLARECAAAAAFTWQTTKISAGSELKGIYSTKPLGLAPLPPEELSALRVLKPKFLSADQHAAILKELDAFGDKFAQHYSDYNKRKSWTSFALRGYNDDPGFIIKPSEMSKTWKEENAALLAEKPRWTEAAKHFPAAKAVVESLGLPLDRVRFMRLRSKDGELSRHADITDREAGVQDGFVTRLHIPIKTSDAVTFFSWSARGEKLAFTFPERVLFYLDQRKPHAVVNKDPALDRVHMVIDCFADAKLRKLIAERERAA